MPTPIRKPRAARFLAVVAIILLTLPACAGHDFKLKNMAKSDIDLVADAHLRTMDEMLRELIVKLYRRNPTELQKNPNQSIESRLRQVFEAPPSAFAELDNKQDIEAMLLCFAPDFNGDRVFALIAGLNGMIKQSYNNKAEFFLFDTLDQQKLYNSARNVEILVWRLSNKRDTNGRLFLLTNDMGEDGNNLSFERLFGKIITIQDMMAKIMADKSKRTITRMVHSLASAAFIPIGL